MNNSFEKQVGNKIKTLRESKKLTQEQLSAKLQVNDCDITRSALAKIEVGQRHIYIDELKMFKKILETSYEELLETLDNH